MGPIYYCCEAAWSLSHHIAGDVAFFLILNNYFYHGSEAFVMQTDMIYRTQDCITYLIMLAAYCMLSIWFWLVAMTTVLPFDEKWSDEKYVREQEGGSWIT